MNIKLVVVGKLKEKYFKQGIAEYAKRLSRFCKFQIVEVPDEKAPESLSQAEMDEVMDKEGSRILDKIKDREYVFALAILGKERSSEQFAKEIADLTTYGHSDITFVIGGIARIIQARIKSRRHPDFVWEIYASPPTYAIGSDRTDLPSLHD